MNPLLWPREWGILTSQWAWVTCQLLELGVGLVHSCWNIWTENGKEVVSQREAHAVPRRDAGQKQWVNLSWYPSNSGLLTISEMEGFLEHQRGDGFMIPWDRMEKVWDVSNARPVTGRKATAFTSFSAKNCWLKLFVFQVRKQGAQKPWVTCPGRHFVHHLLITSGFPSRTLISG